MKFVKIKSHPDYEISETGIIRKIKTMAIKSQYLNDHGYYMVSIRYGKISKPYRVHRLIAETFIPNTENKSNINHINGIKTDNSINNLEWCTQKENMIHAFNTGLVNNTGIKNGMAVLNEKLVLEIKELLKTKLSKQKIADKFNVSRGCILKIYCNKTWVNV
jgi:hypothetical protein